MTPIPRENYRVGLPKEGILKEIFSSDYKKYYGTGDYQNKKIKSKKIDWSYRTHSTELNLPPLGMIALKYS